METKNRPGEPSPNTSRHVDLEALRELTRLMGENDLLELEYQYGELSIRLSKRPSAAPAVAVSPVAAVPAAPAAAAAPAKAAAEEEDRYLKVVSPMVGTFYWAPSPDSPPYVTMGATVNEDTVVCLIEAMKVFNEIKAGVSGKIAKICLKNEQSVEFGQVLFLVEPV